MTRFLGDAIGSRDGRKMPTYTGKELRKNMEKFLLTGSHPDIEKAKRLQAQNAAIVPLPLHDPNRTFVFMDLAAANGQKPLGRLVIELFDEEIPVGANHLRNRCLPGSQAGLAGSTLHKLMPHYAAWIGKNPAASEGMHMPHNTRLRHSEAGAVSVSVNGDEVAIALGSSLPMDSTHQVVGRVHMGKEVLETLNDLQINSDDAPVSKVVVVRCGATNAQGTHEELDASASKANLAERLQEESSNARDSVMSALAEGLLGKRKREQEGAAGPSGSGAAAAAGAAAGAGAGGSLAKALQARSGAPAAGVGRNVKAKLLDAMLGDISSCSSSEDEGDDAGGAE